MRVNRKPTQQRRTAVPKIAIPARRVEDDRIADFEIRYRKHAVRFHYQKKKKQILA